MFSFSQNFYQPLAISAYNIDAGAFLLSWLYRQYGRWDTAYAAYNAGYARVNKWLEDPEISKDGVLVNIPINETEQYVKRCTEAEEIYREVYGDILDKLFFVFIASMAIPVDNGAPPYL